MPEGSDTANGRHGIPPTGKSAVETPDIRKAWSERGKSRGRYDPGFTSSSSTSKISTEPAGMRGLGDWVP